MLHSDSTVTPVSALAGCAMRVSSVLPCLETMITRPVAFFVFVRIRLLCVFLSLGKALLKPSSPLDPKDEKKSILREREGELQPPIWLKVYY